MKLRVFLPALDRPRADTRFAWKLLDARGGVMREGSSVAQEIPKASPVEALLPAERVLFARLKLPRVNATTIRELLPYAVEDRLLADPSQIHAVAGATDARGETLVAVVDRGWLGAMLEALGAAGLRVSNAWCESAVLAGGRDDWHVVLGPSRAMLVDDEGAGVTFDAGDALPLALRIAIDEAGNRGRRPSSFRVHRDGNVGYPDLARWGSEAGVPFTTGGEWSQLSSQPAGPGAIDLLQGDFAGASRLALRVPRGAVALVVIILGLQLAFTAFETFRLQREKRELEARREAIFREAFPQASVVVDPELQMSRNLAELQRTRGLAAGDDFLAQLSRAARSASAPARSVEYRNGTLAIR